MFVRDQFKKAALAASTAESRCSEFDAGIEAIFLSKYGDITFILSTLPVSYTHLRAHET